MRAIASVWIALLGLVLAAPGAYAQKPPAGEQDSPEGVWEVSGRLDEQRANQQFHVPPLTADIVYVELLGENASSDIDIEIQAGEHSYSSASTEATERLLILGGLQGLDITVTHYSGGPCAYRLVCTPLVSQGTLRPGETTQGSVSYSSGRYVLYDVDLPAGEFGVVELHGGAGVGDLDLYVYDANLRETGSSLGPAADERVVVAAGHHVAIQAFDENSHGNFDLTVSLDLHATRLTLGQPCAGEVHDAHSEVFYSVRSPGDGVLDVRVGGHGGSRGEVDLDLQIVGTDGLSKSSVGGDDVERTAFHATAGANYLIRVYGYGDDDIGTFDIVTEFFQEAWTGTRPAGEPVWFGIFMGVEEYASINGLNYTCKDALDCYRTLLGGGIIQPERAIILLDEHATAAGVREAFARVAALARPQDHFVFFYSGHGGEGAPDENGDEIDGDDEYIVCQDSNASNYDGDIIDDELATLCDSVRCRDQILLMDMCFGGGLARDIVNRPGRFGIFSSSEEQESAEGQGFKAGLLAGMIFRGLQGDADANADGVVTERELGRYIADILPRTCPVCQSLLPRNSHSCRVCGESLAGSNAPQIPVIADRAADDVVLSHATLAGTPPTGTTPEEPAKEGRLF